MENASEHFNTLQCSPIAKIAFPRVDNARLYLPLPSPLSALMRNHSGRLGEN